MEKWPDLLFHGRVICHGFIFCTFFIHPSVYRRWGCFRILAVVNHAAVSTRLQISFSKWKSNPPWDINAHLSEWLFSTRRKVTNVGDHVEKREPSWTAGGIVDWCDLCGRQRGGALKIKSRSAVVVLIYVPLSASPWTAACPAPLSTGFSRQERWSVLPFPSPGDREPPWDPAFPLLCGRYDLTFRNRTFSSPCLL